MNISGQLMVVVATAILVSGCASFTAPTYSPHYETIDRLKKTGLQEIEWVKTVIFRYLAVNI